MDCKACEKNRRPLDVFRTLWRPQLDYVRGRWILIIVTFVKIWKIVLKTGHDPCRNCNCN